MSNTDKAIELSNRFKCLPTCERCKNIEDACYSMAKWKDEQYEKEKQQWIDEAVDWLKNSTYGYLKEEGGDVVLDREALANDYALYKKKTGL